MTTNTKSTRGKPARYFIEYADPEWDGEPSYDRSKLEDAATLQQARTLAARRMKDLDTHVGIYERFNFEQIDPPIGPWHSEDKWIEDGRCSSDAEPEPHGGRVATAARLGVNAAAVAAISFTFDALDEVQERRLEKITRQFGTSAASAERKRLENWLRPRCPQCHGPAKDCGYDAEHDICPEYERMQADR